ncbi:galactosyltransferase-related protein [Pedobacter sp. SAFR-022]|uniref:galactosyltransferase-related protein n=1 Tax=Pedobacter sp. SAFR-022 TaxID=3436861 RepID=UPI003F7DF1BD
MLSIIVSWKNRLELSQSISSISNCAEKLGGEVIVVNYDGDTKLLNSQLENQYNINVVQVQEQPFFNKAAAQNIGAYYAKNNYLFFCDCDIILNTEDVVKLFATVSCDSGTFGTLKGVKETIVNSIDNNHIVSFGYQLNIKTRDGRTLKIIDSEEDATDGTRNAPGLLITSINSFRAINGYNSSLHGWGWEDQDMISRLTLGAGLKREISGTALHISHNDKYRTQYYPIADRWESRDKMFRTCLSNYDKNIFSGSFLHDVTRLAHNIIGTF